MKTSSCKGKGRRLQYLIRDKLRAMGGGHGLEADDIKSTPMGSSGVDIQFSPHAARIFPLAIEAKNVEKLNVVGVFCKHYEKYDDGEKMPILVHARNHTKPMVTLAWDDFISLLASYINE